MVRDSAVIPGRSRLCPSSPARPRPSCWRSSISNAVSTPCSPVILRVAVESSTAASKDSPTPVS